MRISPAEAYARMKDEAFTYVDVRTESEFAEGHPEGSINVPLEQADFVAAMEKLFSKSAPIILGCKMGTRSASAAQTLVAAGFTRVLDQRAGWDGTRGPFGELIEPGWSRTGFPFAPLTR